MVEDLNLAQLDDILKSNRLVVVDFSAVWCGPCQKLKPRMHEIADRYVDKVKVVTVDIDQAKDIAERYEVQSIPDVRIFADGLPHRKVLGAQPMDTYMNMLDEILQKEN